MLTPRVLIRSRFDFAQITVVVSGEPWSSTPEYDALVEAEWRRVRSSSRTRLWDGTHYRVRNAGELAGRSTPGTLELGTVRYRYIATYPLLSTPHAALGLGALNHLSTGALIRTSDGLYLFGVRARNGATELIGGGVQRDELQVASGADIEGNLFKEIHEEAGLDREEFAEMRGIGVVQAESSNIIFVGHGQLRLSRAEAERRFAQRTEDEMAEVVFVPEGELSGSLGGLPGYRRLVAELL